MSCTLLWAKRILQSSLACADSSLVSFGLSLWEKKKNHISIQGLGEHFQNLVSKTVLPLSINRGIHTLLRAVMHSIARAKIYEVTRLLTKSF